MKYVKKIDESHNIVAGLSAANCTTDARLEGMPDCFVLLANEPAIAESTMLSSGSEVHTKTVVIMNISSCQVVGSSITEGVDCMISSAESPELTSFELISKQIICVPCL